MPKLGSCEISWISVGGVVVLLSFLLLVVKPVVLKFLLQRKLNRWKKTPKDTIVLHGFPPVKSLPNMSPFVLKVETYLRLANLPYTWDRSDFFGPKGKSPWISLNGSHVADSEFIIQHLGRKFDKDFSTDISTEQLAVARVVRTMLEEYFSCVIGLERMVYNDRESFNKIVDMPVLWYYYMKYTIKNRFWEQGVARHSKEEVTDIMTKNLKAVSTLLGEKRFFGGDKICEDDCGVFGVLANCLWGLPDGTVYEGLLNGECSNLKEYCLRVKEKLWADWDHCVAKD